MYNPLSAPIGMQWCIQRQFALDFLCTSVPILQCSCVRSTYPGIHKLTRCTNLKLIDLFVLRYTAHATSPRTYPLSTRYRSSTYRYIGRNVTEVFCTTTRVENHIKVNSIVHTVDSFIFIVPILVQGKNDTRI